MRGNCWQTPDSFLECVRAVDAIALDPCSTSDNPTGARRFLTPESTPDGLASDWRKLAGGGLVYANIPFGRGAVDRWVDKAIEEVAKGVELVLLTRGDTSTQWARRLIRKGHPALICFPKRIRFQGATGSPNFANLVFYFGPRPEAFARAFREHGPMVAPLPEINSPSRSAATRRRATNRGRSKS